MTTTHWQASTSAGDRATDKNPAEALRRILDGSNARKIMIIEGKSDGGFFSVAYSRNMPRSFTLSRRQARAYIENPATIPNLTAFA